VRADDLLLQEGTEKEGERGGHGLSTTMTVRRRDQEGKGKGR
jgi:hypothetical protein